MLFPINGCTHAFSVVLHAHHLNALLVAPRCQFDGPEVQLDLFHRLRDALFILMTTATRVWTTEVQNGAVRNVLLYGTWMKLGVYIHNTWEGSLRKREKREKSSFNEYLVSSNDHFEANYKLV